MSVLSRLKEARDTARRSACRGLAEIRRFLVRTFRKNKVAPCPLSDSTTSVFQAISTDTPRQDTSECEQREEKKWHENEGMRVEDLEVVSRDEDEKCQVEEKTEVAAEKEEKQPIDDEMGVVDLEAAVEEEEEKHQMDKEMGVEDLEMAVVDEEGCGADKLEHGVQEVQGENRGSEEKGLQEKGRGDEEKVVQEVKEEGRGDEDNGIHAPKEEGREDEEKGMEEAKETERGDDEKQVQKADDQTRIDNMTECHFQTHRRIKYWELQEVHVDGEPVIVGQGTFGFILLQQMEGKLVVEKTTFGETDVVKVERTIAETAAYQAVSGIPGFPKYYGTVDRKPIQSFIIEYLGDDKTLTTWTLLDLCDGKGPRLTKIQVMKVLIDVVYALDAQQKAGWYHGDIKSNNVMIVEDTADDVFSGKMVDLGLSTQISDKVFKPHLDLDNDDLEKLMADYPHVAPERLLRVTGVTHASETYAVGFLCEEVSTAFGIPSLGQLSLICMSMNMNTSRPSMEGVLEHLNRCLKEERAELDDARGVL